MYDKHIRLWLFCGAFMLFVQIILGGITRLTGSGLSIIRWEIITGTIPPLNEIKWQQEFDKYKATPQYQKLNEGMSLTEFKFIYFWEYFHRLWARTMGFVFAIPFFIFLIQKKLDKPLIGKLIMVILLSALVASFGWIMVKSGLVDRPWVNPYKLTLHLSLALVVYGYVLWLALFTSFDKNDFVLNTKLKRMALLIFAVVCIQLVLGGLMSGMKAGLFYPTFPDMHGQFIPSAMLSSESWSLSAFTHFDKDPFAVAFIHFFHRLTAYLLTVLIFWFYFLSRQFELRKPLSIAITSLVITLIVQVSLGILTVLNSKSGIPVALGVMHQAGAVLLLSATISVNFLLRRKST